jgi:hypothetical protein
MKGNIEIVQALRANIHVFVFTYTYNNLFFERFIYFVYIPFDFVAKYAQLGML